MNVASLVSCLRHTLDHIHSGVLLGQCPTRWYNLQIMLRSQLRLQAFFMVYKHRIYWPLIIRVVGLITSVDSIYLKFLICYSTWYSMVFFYLLIIHKLSFIKNIPSMHRWMLMMSSDLCNYADLSPFLTLEVHILKCSFADIVRFTTVIWPKYLLQWGPHYNITCGFGLKRQSGSKSWSFWVLTS